MKDKLKLIHKHYAKRIEKETEDYKILDWESEEEHKKRFSVFTSAFSDIQGESILDVGCGLGNFAEYLDEKNIAAQYTGVDILTEMIDLSSKKTFKRVKAEFLKTDIFLENSLIKNRKFDYIFASGIFNLNLGNNIDFFDNAIKLFFSIAKKGICFNLLGIQAQGLFGDKYFYYDKNEIEEKIILYKNETEKYIIEENKHDFSFVIYLK